MHKHIDLIFLLQTADQQPLARLDYTTMSDQALLELCIAGMEGISHFQDPSGDFCDIVEWDGVKFDANSQLSDLLVWRRFSGGNFALEWLPGTLKHVGLDCNTAEGTVPWKLLPDSLLTFSLFDNNFTGSIDLTFLPQNLRGLMLGRNKFSGTLEWHALPLQMELLELSDNVLTGEVDLSDIHIKICKLDYELFFDIENGEEKPPGEASFGINLRRNLFQGDVRLHDISMCTDEGQFSGLKSRRMVDRKGNVESLL